MLFRTGVFAASPSYEELFRQGAELTAHGDFPAAIERYQAALALRPDAPEALNNLAVVYYQAHRYPEAYSTASRILRSHPEMLSASLIAGLAAVQCNRPGDALNPLKQVLTSQPQNRDAILGLASAQVALGHLPEAVDVYQRAIQNSSTDELAWYGVAICYERMAEQASRRLSAMPGGIPYFKRLLGEYLSNRGDQQLASEAFGEANTATGPNFEAAANQYANARELAGRSQDAFEHFVSLAPNSWQAQLFQGDVARQQRAFQRALSHYEAALKQQPDSPAALLGMGTVHWEMGEFDEAEKSLRRVLALNPGSVQATFELGNIAVRRHRDTDAITLLLAFLKGEPDAAAARADLGRAYLHLGQYSDAVEQLRRAASSDPDGEIHYQLALALRNLGQNDAADRALTESSAIRRAALERAQQRLK